MQNSIIKYLSDLSENNNREWYHANKEEYKIANAQFEDIIESLITEIGKADSSILGFPAKELTFKLVRDTRFSHDKSPYNPSFRCHISSKGKLPIPVGYYLYISPNNRSFLGGGLFADMFKDATAMVREYISAHGDEWKKLIKCMDFTELFTVGGAESALKNVPKGYDINHPQADYLKYKSWYIEYPFNDTMLDDISAFVDFASKAFIRMKPFNDFLNSALNGFQMPSR